MNVRIFEAALVCCGNCVEGVFLQGAHSQRDGAINISGGVKSHSRDYTHLDVEEYRDHEQVQC